MINFNQFLRQKNEGYLNMPAIDKDRYTEIPGLDGPIATKSGKVLYYDPKEGKYYDRDTDMYLSNDEYMNYDKTNVPYHQSPLTDPSSKEYQHMQRNS